MPSLYEALGIDLPYAVARRQPMLQPTIDPATEDSLLSTLAGGGLSALGFVGNVLDTPGAFVRNMAVGQNPFPGIFDPEQRVSGRDVLEHYGVLNSNTPGPDWGDVAGFAAEVGLDPLTYLSFGASALTKAGKAADAAGTLAKATYGAGGELLQGARAAQMAAGQRALVGVGLPFMDNVAAFGAGPLAQKIAGGLDTVGDYARFGNPVGLAAGALFDPTVMSATTREGQINARRIWELERAGEADALSRVADVAYPLLEKGGLGGTPEDIAARVAFMENEVPLPAHLQQLAPELSRLREMVGPQELMADINMGLDTPMLEDLYRRHYVPQLPADFGKQNIADFNRKVMDSSYGFQKGRKEVYKNIEGGRGVVNEMSLDPFVSGAEAASKANQLQRAKYLRDSYLGFNDQELIDANNSLKSLKGQLAKAETEQTRLAIQRQISEQAARAGELAYTFKKSFNLADSLAALPENHIKEGVPLFPNDPLYDSMKRMVAGGKARGRAQGTYEYLGSVARMTPHPGDVPLLEVARKAGLGTQIGERLTDDGVELLKAKAFAEQALGTSLEDDALEVLRGLEAKDSATLVDQATNGMFTQLQKAMGSKGDPRFAYVPKEAQDLVTKTLRLGMSPDSAQPVLAFVDKFTNLFKVGMLTWPSRFVRDLYSGLAINAMDGALSWRGVKAAHAMATQGVKAVFDGANSIKEFSGLTPEQASVELMKEMFAHKVVSPFGGAWQDITSARVAGTQIAGELPGGVPQSLKSTFVDPWKEKGALNLLEFRGFGPLGKITTETRLAPVKIAENISHYTDTINRASPYIEYRLQGLSPEVAAAKVKLAQVDYTHLSDFEKKYMKRLVPFYSFTRRMVPKVFKDLLEKPGGRLAQTIRAENLSRDDQFLPPYLAPGLAIRLPEELGPGNGDTRYLTSIDLPHESVFQLFRPSNSVLGTIQNTGMGLLGMANPLVKAPMELATGKQFYSGRDLTDLDSRIGRTLNPEHPVDVPIWLDELAMNSPLSRVISMVGTLADDRKGWGGFLTNAASGMKISDVNVEQSRDRIARDAIEEMLQGNPSVRTNTSFYVPQGQRDSLSPEDKLLMQEYSAIRNRARERAQQRNAGAGRL